MKPDKFITFLRESGAEILEPTNPYEIVRFRTLNGVSVMYKGRRGYSFTGEAAEAFDRFEHKSIWRIKSNSQKLKDRAMADLLERDGKSCFFCVGTNDLTIEHLLPISDGGNNNMKNLCLACERCNQAVGNMSIIEKILYRETVRSKRLKRQTAQSPMTHFSGEETENMAKCIHCPECWDTAAYPTLADAIYEIVLNEGCSEHRMPEASNG